VTLVAKGYRAGAIDRQQALSIEADTVVELPVKLSRPGKDEALVLVLLDAAGTPISQNTYAAGYFAHE
jgi:hypothetical protein